MSNKTISPILVPKTDDLYGWFDRTLKAMGINAATHDELNCMVVANAMLRRNNKTKRDVIDNPYNESPFAYLEGNGKGQKKQTGKFRPHFALDRDAMQILRSKDPKVAAHWERFGLQRVENDQLAVFTRPNEDHVNDIGTALPQIATGLNTWRSQGLRMVALLGKARLNIKEGMELIEPIQDVVTNLPDAVYMTGGFRGVNGNNYGVTRAGFDVPQSTGLPTALVMCSAGVDDSHQSADAASIYGTQWGDDTPGLVASSDGAIFFRNIPAGKNFGAWTEVEIARFISAGKPLAIVDPTTKVDKLTYFGSQVSVFFTGKQAAAYLAGKLPTTEAVKQMPKINTPDPKQLHQHTSGDDQENFLAVRLYYSDEMLGVNDMRAMWINQSDDARSIFIKHGLKFISDKHAFEGERDLVLDGYWKDIMLLRHFSLIGSGGQTESLVMLYAQYRRQLEAAMLQDPSLRARSRVDIKSIDDIWFMYGREHDPAFIALLQSQLLPDEQRYVDALAATQALSSKNKFKTEAAVLTD